MISGNLFPMTADNSSFRIGWKIYSAVIWLILIIIVIGFFFGFMLVPKAKAISDGMIGTVFIVEVFFMVVRIHTKRNLVKKFIQNMNDILHVQDETMRHIVISSLKLMHSPFKFYWLSGIITSTIWIGVPFTSVFKKSSFFYEDFRLPFAISKQPFSTEIFLLGEIMLTICSIFIVGKKVAVDIYMLNFVLLMTAQYRYIAMKLENIFQEEYSEDNYNNSQQKHRPKTKSWAETEIKAVCRHHNTVV
ncbi:uncharacterized protein LOC105429268 [Pogonomyrmex barbatus]|uniref:Uncharacterized protein LOC105429268 n=1 Tax=Pogonomyrmex barbatus TaxID=144034 RepID=A0A6I9WLQ3_9HYME|nr:uncharacterized protein LOC105429268 [Pogonomyrmex barbatus]